MRKNRFFLQRNILLIEFHTSKKRYLNHVVCSTQRKSTMKKKDTGKSSVNCRQITLLHMNERIPFVGILNMYIKIWFSIFVFFFFFIHSYATLGNFVIFLQLERFLFHIRIRHHGFFSTFFSSFFISFPLQREPLLW